MRYLYRGKRILQTFLFFCATLVLAPAEPQYRPDDILINVRDRMNSVRDYSAEVNVSVDIPRLRMPVKKVHIYFKQPDKFAVKTSGFAIVPKIGLLPAQMASISKNAEMFLRSTPEDNSDNAYIIDIHPRDLNNKMTSTVWVNAHRWTIDKVLMEAPDVGKTVVKIHYQNIDGVWLPDTTTVFLDMMHSIPEMQRPSVEFPVGYSGGASSDEPLKGTIRIRFDNYRVNQGIGDDVFNE